MSLLCLALTGETLLENFEHITSFGNRVDCLELRADFLKSAELHSLARFPGLVDLPVVLTIRRKKEGGRFEGSEAERLRLLKKAVPGGYRYLDLEEDLNEPELERLVLRAGGSIVRSIHDFAGIPEGLAGRIKKLARRPGDIPKAAVMPKTSRGLLKLMEVFSELRGMRKILIGMGEAGLPTRILAARLGSELTYCSPPGRQAAPGHLDPATLLDLYRFKSITETTGVFGVIGNPIGHSLSPAIHNRGFEALGIDAVYLPFLVDEPESFFRMAGLLGIRGLSVTIPLKEAVIPFLTERDERVEATGACNTMFRRNEGWFGTNTDAGGFLKPLEEGMKNKPVSALKATVVGAGGAARAVVYALVGLGARTLILNRTVEKAEILARKFGCDFAGINGEGYRLMKNYSDLIVQTTSVGMEPDLNKDPLPDYRFKGHEIAYDLVYRPPQTLFLKRAAAAGCRTIPGLEMLFNQAVLQFKLFTGRDYPKGAFDS